MYPIQNDELSKMGAGFLPLAVVSLGGVAGGLSYLNEYGDNFKAESFAFSIALGATTACFGTLGVIGRALSMFNAANTKVVIHQLQT